MRDILGYLQQNWTWIAGVGGASTAVAVFVRECLTIAKLRRELSALKQKAEEDNKKSDSVIKVPSDEEIRIYSGHALRYDMARRSIAHSSPGFDLTMRRAHRSVLLPAIMVVCLSALGYFAWSFFWRIATAVLISSVAYILVALLFVRLAGSRAIRRSLEQEVWRQRRASDLAALGRIPH